MYFIFATPNLNFKLDILIFNSVLHLGFKFRSNIYIYFWKFDSKNAKQLFLL